MNMFQEIMEVGIKRCLFWFEGTDFQNVHFQNVHF